MVYAHPQLALLLAHVLMSVCPPPSPPPPTRKAPDGSEARALYTKFKLCIRGCSAPTNSPARGRTITSELHEAVSTTRHEPQTSQILKQNGNIFLLLLHTCLVHVNNLPSIFSNHWCSTWTLFHQMWCILIISKFTQPFGDLTQEWPAQM